MVNQRGFPLAAALLSVLLLTGSIHPDFTMKSLNVFVNVNLDGSANVEEQLYAMMNGSQSRDLYEGTRSAYSDLSTWQERTNLSELRHHITRAKADISDIRVTPQTVERCNSFLGVCYANIVLTYKVNANGTLGSGLVKVERYKPRTANYTLIPEALSFEQTKSGDLILPAGTVISFSIPQAAEKIQFSATPENVASEGAASTRYDQSQNINYYVGTKRIFTWKGDTLSKFHFTYEVEQPLESEVMAFFRDSQSSVISFLTGTQGIAALVLVATAAVSLYSLNRLSKG